MFDIRLPDAAEMPLPSSATSARTSSISKSPKAATKAGARGLRIAGEDSLQFIEINRNKPSVVLDFKTADGCEKDSNRSRRCVERQRQYARKFRCGDRAHLLSSPPRSLLKTRELPRALCTG